MGALGVLAPFVFQYTFRRPELTEVYMLTFFVPHLASVPCWMQLTRRFRKVDLWIASRAIALSGYAATFVMIELVRGGGANTLESMASGNAPPILSVPVPAFPVISSARMIPSSTSSSPAGTFSSRMRWNSR